MIDFLVDYKWGSFGIAFVLLGIIPVWILTFFPLGFFTKLLATLVLGVIIFIAVKTGGAKRGFIARR